MEKGIHFISGLPRSGSTLLGAILAQNPRYHGGMSTPVAPMFIAMQATLSGKSEFHALIDDRQRTAILRGIFTSYYEEIHPLKTVFDTNRAWCSRLSAIAKLFPASRMICCVRSLAWIYDSLERIVQQNPLQPSRIFNFDVNTNLITRLEMLSGPNGVVGASYNALKEAYFGDFSDRIILVTYESLTERPADTMSSIYRFLGEDPYSHDFDSVEFDAAEFDFRLGTAGLHKVRRKVAVSKRQTVLPSDIVKKCERNSFWMDRGQNPRGVTII